MAGSQPNQANTPLLPLSTPESPVERLGADFNREVGKATQRACRGSESYPLAPFLFSAIPTSQISRMLALLELIYQSADMYGLQNYKLAL